MRNIKLIIEYDGTRFNGWQTQKTKTCPAGKKTRTVQEKIEDSLKKLFGKPVKLIGAGRTDTGVHAKAQIANFKIDSSLCLDNIRNGLNSFLPKDISIVSLEEAPLNFHARFKAKSKLYKYTILNRKSRSPLLRNFSLFIPYDLDIGAMKKAAKYLTGTKDFKSFQKTDKKNRASVRTVNKIDIAVNPPLIEIYIHADGFLYNMARNIVGTLLDVGRKKIPPAKVKEILSKRYRPLAGQTAPAKGLCLEKIFY